MIARARSAHENFETNFPTLGQTRHVMPPCLALCNDKSTYYYVLLVMTRDSLLRELEPTFQKS